MDGSGDRLPVVETPVVIARSSGFTRFRRGERGFTLIEVMVSMLIFSIVTLGVVPLLASAMKGATISRSSSVGEELTRNAMERIRGVKYFTSFDAKPNKRVDLLDLYYPGVSGSFYSGQTYAVTTNPPLTGTGGVFTTSCSNPPPPPPTNPACPPKLPAGYSLTFKASFVKAIKTTTPQTYEIVTPPSNYRWNTAAGGNQLPADLLDLAATASWSVGGKTRTFTLRSILGERNFAPAAAVNAGPTPSAPPSSAPVGSGPSVRGRATVDYTFHGETGFSSASTGPGCSVAPCKSEMIADIGLGESRIELQDFATADQFTSYGNVRVVRTYPAGQTPPNPPPDDLVNVSGATTTLHAPPTQNLATHGTVGNQFTFLNEVSTSVSQATLSSNQNSNVKVGVENALPYAEGTAGTTQTFQGSAEFGINNSQRDANAMKWYSIGGPFAGLTGPWTYSVPNRLRSFTSATTGALGTAGRGVTATAEAGFPYLQMFQVAIGNSSAYTLLVQDLRTSVTCKSTANPATATATASHFAWLTFHHDPANDGKAPRAMESIILTLNSAAPDQYGGVNVADALAQLRTVNPLIWDGTSLCSPTSCSTTADIHLFEERNASGTLTKRGYFKSITVNKSHHTYVSPDGRTTQASIEGFLRLDTTPLAPAIPETATSISMGKVSCESVDNR